MTLPTGMISVLDIAKRVGNDQIVGLIDETTKAIPEVAGRAARTITGLGYKTRVRVGLPSVGFRNINEGSVRTKARYEQRWVETYTLNPRWSADKAAADRDENGWAAVLAEEAEAHVAAGFQHVAKQFYYGINATYGDAKGFPGLLDSYDATNMVVDAGGTTATTGSSAWLVAFGPQRIQWVYGGGGQFELSEVDLRDIDDADGNQFTAYHQELMAYPGLQVSSQMYAVRIKKLTADSGKGLTDDLVADALMKFQVGVRPDVIFCTRRSLGQLLKDRVATNPTGAPAPIPTESHGIPIAITEALLDTEPLTL